MELPRGDGGVPIGGGGVKGRKRGREVWGLGEGARLRGEEERGRVGMKRNMERRDGLPRCCLHSPRNSRSSLSCNFTPNH